MDCKASKPCLLVIDGDYFGKHALQGGAFLSFSILLVACLFFGYLFKKKCVLLFVNNTCRYFVILTNFTCKYFCYTYLVIILLRCLLYS